MRKLRPSNYWNLGKIENWLSDMASEGYFLQTMDSNFCDFEEGEAKTLSYRIEIAQSGKNLSQEQQLKYKEDIWTKVTTYKKFHVFSCSSELLTSEPNPSPEALGKALKPIFHKTLLNLFLWVLIPSLIIRFLPYISSSSFLISILRGTVFNITPYAIFIWIILTLCIDLYYQWKLIRRLSKGIALDHHATWKKTYWISSAVWNIKIVLIAGFLLSPIILSQILLPHIVSKDLSATETPVPIVRFEDVETADGSPFDKTLFQNGYYYKGVGLLAPKQIYSDEYIRPYGGMRNEYFKLTFPSTQKLIVNAFVDSYDKLYKDLDSSGTESFNTESIETDSVDYLIYGVSSNNNNKHIFAAKDGVVLHLEYWGSKGKDELIKAVSDFFTTKIKED